MCFQFCTLPNLERFAQACQPGLHTTQISCNYGRKTKGPLFLWLALYFTEGCGWCLGADKVWPHYWIPIVDQVLHPLVHGSMVKLNHRLEERERRGARAHNTFKATKNLPLQIISNCFQLSQYQFILIHVHNGPMIFKFIIQSWFQRWFQFVLTNCFYFSCEYIFPLDASHPPSRDRAQMADRFAQDESFGNSPLCLHNLVLTL